MVCKVIVCTMVRLNFLIDHELSREIDIVEDNFLPGDRRTFIQYKFSLRKLIADCFSQLICSVV